MPEKATTTSSNTEGRVTLRLTSPGMDRKQYPNRGKDQGNSPNPKHREDFERPLGRMARSSE